MQLRAVHPEARTDEPSRVIHVDFQAVMGVVSAGAVPISRLGDMQMIANLLDTGQVTHGFLH